MNNLKSVIILEPGGRKRPGLYADIPVPVILIPAVEEGRPAGLPNLLKEEEKEEDEGEKNDDHDDKEQMEGKRRDEEDMQDSLVVEEGIMVRFSLVCLVIFLLSLQLLLQGSFHEEEVKQPNNNKAFKSLPTPIQHKICQHSSHVFVCKGCGKKFSPNNNINRHNKLVYGKPHHRKSLCNISMWGKDHFNNEGDLSHSISNGTVWCFSCIIARVHRNCGTLLGADWMEI